MKPAAHGTPLNYRRGCRCLPCRAAISEYEAANSRRRRNGGEWRGKVPARPTQMRLAHMGVPIQAVADVTGIHAMSLFRIKRGERKTVWKSTEEKVLSLNRQKVFKLRESLVPDHANVPAEPVRKMMRRLKREGFSRREVVKRIGLASDLRLDRPTMKAWRAMEVEKFYNKIMAA